MTGAELFIAKQRIGPDDTDAGAFKAAFAEAMKNGLAGRPSTLAMIPTYISCGAAPAADSRAIAVDIGGTNLRTGLVTMGEGGPRLESFTTRPTPGSRGSISWEDFIDILAESVRPLMRCTDRLGLCVSFPTTITPERDGAIRRLTKEVDITGFEGRYICRDLMARLGAENTHAICLNDTAAVLLSGMAHGAQSAGLVGLILGTGTNICCQVSCRDIGVSGQGGMITAIESGGFVPPMRGDIDMELDRHTAEPGVYLEEKMVSGAYLGELCRIALCRAAENGVFSAPSARALSAMDVLTTPEADAFGAGGALPGLSTGEDENAARQIVRAVFERAAKHIACSLAAVREFTGEERLTVSADGSVFNKSAVFSEAFARYSKLYLPAGIKRIITAEDSTIIGAAVGAMLE